MIPCDVGLRGWVKPMCEGVAATIRRNAFRFALTGIAGIWLSGCADATRFADTGNPFSNPFATASNETAAPTPSIASKPLAAAKPYGNGYATSARPSPYAASGVRTPTPDATGSIRSEPVGGTANGWTAVGGSPIVVGAADDASSLSARYGVPESALLAANGLHARTEIHANMRIVIPVYNSHGGGDARVGKADEGHSAKARHAKRDDDASDDTPKSKRAETDRKKHAAEAKRDDADEKDAHKKLAKSEKLKSAEDSEKPAKAEKTAKAAKPAPQVATTEAPRTPKKPETDKTPTGDLGSGASSNSEASKLRWPARGRIIMGFKQGGNDGINIALPEGTSVRAAEDGKVAYAGNALKGYGNLVLIRHPNGFVTAYANNGEIDVKSGDTVKRGQVIAKSGQTGDVSSPQLHFEVRKGQTPVDPTGFLAGL